MKAHYVLSGEETLSGGTKVELRQVVMLQKETERVDKQSQNNLLYLQGSPGSNLRHNRRVAVSPTKLSVSSEQISPDFVN